MGREREREEEYFSSWQVYNMNEMEHLSIRLTNVTYIVQTWQLSRISFSVFTNTYYYRYPIIHLSFSFLNSLKASIGDLQPTFSCKDFCIICHSLDREMKMNDTSGGDKPES